MSFRFVQADFRAYLHMYSFVEGRFVKFFTSIPKVENQRFYDTYNMSKFVGGEGDIDSIIFSIVRKDGRNPDNIAIKEYYPFEADEVSESAAGALTYSEEEVDFFRERYAPADPEIQVDLTPPAGNYNSSQDTVENIGVLDSSLSSLGESVEEQFTITATAGSATELITTATEQISDVGGTISRDRTIKSEDVRVGSSTTQDVTTSGY